MNSKKKANIATGKAISYFSLHGNTISLPVGDCEKYDLVVDLGQLKKVQCKYTDSKAPSGAYKVQLRTYGGYKEKVYMTKYETGDFDKLYVYCGNGDEYFIPAEKVVGMAGITVGKKWLEYRLT